MSSARPTRTNNNTGVIRLRVECINNNITCAVTRACRRRPRVKFTESAHGLRRREDVAAREDERPPVRDNGRGGPLNPKHRTNTGSETRVRTRACRHYNSARNNNTTRTSVRPSRPRVTANTRVTARQLRDDDDDDNHRRRQCNLCDGCCLKCAGNGTSGHKSRVTAMLTTRLARRPLALTGMLKRYANVVRSSVNNPPVQQRANCLCGINTVSCVCWYPQRFPNCVRSVSDRESRFFDRPVITSPIRVVRKKSNFNHPCGGNSRKRKNI